MAGVKYAGKGNGQTICARLLKAKVEAKPSITPHFFRHNYVTLLYESGVDPLVAMKIVGHTDYQTTASIYTHLKEETLKKASVNMEKVFQSKAGRDAD